MSTALQNFYILLNALWTVQHNLISLIFKEQTLLLKLILYWFALVIYVRLLLNSKTGAVLIIGWGVFELHIDYSK